MKLVSTTKSKKRITYKYECGTIHHTPRSDIYAYTGDITLVRKTGDEWNYSDTQGTKTLQLLTDYSEAKLFQEAMKYDAYKVLDVQKEIHRLRMENR